MAQDPLHPAADSRVLRWALTGGTSYGDFASAIYGTILAGSLLIAIAGGPLMIIATTLITAVVFWLAHVHVSLVREVVRSREPLTWRATRRALYEEWPLAQASLSPLVPMVLAAADLITVGEARTLGVLICLIGLIAWGIVIARVAHFGRRQTAWMITVNVTLGMALIVLKIIVH